MRRDKRSHDVIGSRGQRSADTHVGQRQYDITNRKGKGEGMKAWCVNKVLKYSQ